MAEFYSARGWEIPPLPWTNLSPPFSHRRHSRLKDFLRPRRGIATRYLDNYLSWFHLVGLAPGANDRACLAAAVTS